MSKKELALQVVNINAAGIDVGSRSHFVAIDQVKSNVREFGVYTKDHKEMIRYLHKKQLCSLNSRVLF